MITRLMITRREQSGSCQPCFPLRDMRRNRIILTVVGFIAAHSAFAQGGPQLLGHFGDWNAYVAAQSGQKVCFALSEPRSGAMPGRGRSFMMIATRPAQQVWNELSFLMGYSFDPNTEATVQLGAESFALYTKDDGAWLRNLSDKGRMIDAMLREPALQVRGTSAQGMRTVDRYSLTGLGPAIDRATQECRRETPVGSVSPSPSPGPPSLGTACQRFPNLC